LGKKRGHRAAGLDFRAEMTEEEEEEEDEEEEGVGRAGIGRDARNKSNPVVEQME